MLYLLIRTTTHALADLEMMVQHLKFIRSVTSMELWKSAIIREVDPGPQCTTDEEIRSSFIAFFLKCYSLTPGVPEYIRAAQHSCW